MAANLLFLALSLLAMLVVALPFVAALVWAVRLPGAWVWGVFVVGIVGYVPVVALALGLWVLNPLQIALGVTG